MRQQIIVSGIGGQGVLFLTRVLAQAGLDMGLEVLTSETHGMAMRGGTVISHVKVGPFRSPLVMRGCADTGLILHRENVALHGDFIKQGGYCVVNTDEPGSYLHVDALAYAREIGSLVVANLVLLGFAVRQGALFCDQPIMEQVISEVSQPRNLEMNLRGFRRGIQL